MDMIQQQPFLNGSMKPLTTAPTEAQIKAMDQKKLEKAASQLEGVFISMVLKKLRETVPKDDLFNNDTSQMFTEMLDDKLGEKIAGSKGIGLAKTIVQSMQRIQAASNKPTNPMSISPH